MTFKNVIKTLAVLILTVSGSAMAQNATITAGSASVDAGAPATIDLTWNLNGTSSRSLQFDLTFDPVALPAVDASGCPAIGYTASDGFIVAQCTDQGGGTWRMGWARISGDVASGVVGTLVFDTLPAATPGDYPLTISGVVIETGTADITNGAITINPPPQPFFNATPANVSLSGQISTTLAGNVVIDNSGGEATSSLDYTCTETADPDNKFTLSGETNKVIGTTETGTINVACDSSAIGGPWSGNVECTHNGSNTSPMNVPLACTVTAGPEPAYTGVASGLAMVATEQGDPDPAGSVAITNTGDPTTTLTGTCTLTGPDTEITLSNGGFSVAEGAAAHSAAVSCDASAQGNYANTLSCTHNGTNTSSPVDYPVTCSVGPPGPAVYASTPADGAVIDMTTEDVPVGAVVPDQVLTITNAAPEANDRDLLLTNCAMADGSTITATVPTTPLAAGASTDVTFSCSTAVVGAFSDTFSCDYWETGNEVEDGTATYTVNCGVREAASDILESPISGTALTILVPIGGTGQTSVSFDEILDEGVEATVDACSFGTTTFSVLSTLPVTVTAGGTVKIDVQGSDDGSGSLTFTDTLTCTYTDTDSTPGTASWPITLTVLAQPIPTLSTWGLMLMILTLMGLGGIVIRRKVES